MRDALMNLLLLPFRIVAFLLEMLGRTLALIIGLICFGLGALLCTLGPLVIIGAPICLLSILLVVKAL